MVVAGPALSDSSAAGVLNTGDVLTIGVEVRKSKGMPATARTSPVGSRSASTGVENERRIWSTWSTTVPEAWPPRLKEEWWTMFTTVAASAVALISG